MAHESFYDPFQALGLSRHAGLKTIKSKYRELARKYHPNRNQGSDEAKCALTEHFHNVHQAWDSLKRTDWRRRYVERLELQDLHDALLSGIADLLSSEEREDQSRHERKRNSIDGHVSSDADEDDIPRLQGIFRRQTFERDCNGHEVLAAVHNLNGHNESNLATKMTGKSTSASSRNRASSRESKESDHGAATLRRKKLEKLRKKEFEAFIKYENAMHEKFQAEFAAEEYKEAFERARWRREYMENTPQATSQRLRRLKNLTSAIKALSPGLKPQQPTRRRNRSTVSLAGQILSTGDPFDDNHFLNLPALARFNHRKGWSSDISGDQTSSDEYSSGRNSSTSRSPHRPPRPDWRKHRKWDSVPIIPTIQTSKSLAKNNIYPISPISGPGPKVFVRTPTKLDQESDAQQSDADAGASASSRSASSQRDDPDAYHFTLNSSSNPWDIGSRDERRGRSLSAGRHNGIHLPAHQGTHNSSNDPNLLEIKLVRQVEFKTIPFDHVHLLSAKEEDWLLSVPPDADQDPAQLLSRLAQLDSSVAEKFMVKSDIKSDFKFRLIYSHREVVRHQHQSFIALSYRRRIHADKHHNHFTLPMDQEMLQAVMDERITDTEGVWIDQICIDQDSEEEKTVSMSAMDMVYRSARLVVVALDDILLDSHEAELLQNHMDEYIRMAHVPPNKRFRRRQPPYLDAHEDLSTIILKMLRSSWFKRAWCRHEMRLAREHVFLLPCRCPGTWSGKNVVRLTGICLTHLLGLATEVPFELETEQIKPALYAFFRDRSKLSPSETHLQLHHGNFTTVVSEVFAMEAGGDPRIPAEQRAADARKDQISIILNTMECGLALQQKVRDTDIVLPRAECNYMLLLLALAARDPGALCSVGHQMQSMSLTSAVPGVISSWLFEPTNVDAGLNNYRTLNRLPHESKISTYNISGEHSVQLDLKFLRHEKVRRPLQSQSLDSLSLAKRFMTVCDERKLGRYRKRYLLTNETANKLFGSMREIYTQTLACVLELGPDWLADICQNYGVSRWRNDLKPARELLIAFQNTVGRWPEKAWSSQAAGFILDFVNFLVIRGLPQRQVTEYQPWRPIWVTPPMGGKVLSFVPVVPYGGNIEPAVPAALLDPDYIHLARMWLLEPRGKHDDPDCVHREWTLLGKSVLFSNTIATEQLHSVDWNVREAQRVFGKVTTRHS